ncbi:MAG: DUF4145 domain-containing protein [Candidatus Diapherotrites archaeon]|nr:DUF4145 domain-containing protein [Candidatus Diapherotrites archaeon]
MKPIEIYCPWCYKHVALVWIALRYGIGHRGYATEKIEEPIFYNTAKGNWSIGMCPSCKNCVLIKINDKRSSVFPNPLPTPTDERIPEKIRKDIDEAKLCLSVNAFRACAGMCRRALQQACILKSASPKKKLEKQIDELAERRIITNEIKEWAHAIRWVGNDALHPEFPEVAKEEAKEILDLTERFMDIAFAASERVKKLKEKHGKVKK